MIEHFEILTMTFQNLPVLKQNLSASGMIISRVNNQETTIPKVLSRANCHGEVYITFECSKAFIYCLFDFIFSRKVIQYGIINFD